MKTEPSQTGEQEASAPPQPSLTDEQILACVRSVLLPRPRGLTRDVGPYEVTEPTHYLRTLVRAIESARAAPPQPVPAEPPRLPIKGAHVEGAYVVVTPIGRTEKDARKLREAIMALAATPLVQPAPPIAAKSEIVTAWIQGYYHAGYTHDSAYAEKQAEEYARGLSDPAGLQGHPKPDANPDPSGRSATDAS
jgi:hypothetical protein